MDPRLLVSGIADAVDLASLAAARLQPEWAAIGKNLASLTAALDQTGANPATVDDRLSDHAENAETIVAAIQALPEAQASGTAAQLLFWVEAARRAIGSHRRDAENPLPGNAALVQRLQAIEHAARDMALAMEFGFLLDPKRKLLSIGYLVHEDELPELLDDLLLSSLLALLELFLLSSFLELDLSSLLLAIKISPN